MIIRVILISVIYFQIGYCGFKLFSRYYLTEIKVIDDLGITIDQHLKWNIHVENSIIRLLT